MAGIIEFGNTCTCAQACGGEVCWRPAQGELKQLLAAWRLRNPSVIYGVTSDAARHRGRSLTWNPRRREIWILLAAPGPWRQVYAVGEEQILMRQFCADGSEESFVIEPIMRNVPFRLGVPQVVPVA